MNKYVYAFSEGNKDMKDLLGGKGANMAEMMSLGLPVPRGFTVTTKACNEYYASNKTLSNDIEVQIFDKIKELEELTGKEFGSVSNPLLLSVRSGARSSMPGMMDTILNLGLNDEIVNSLVRKTDNKRFVYDSYRRFIQMYADVVKGYPKSSFERYFDQIKEEKGINSDLELSSDDLLEVVNRFKENYKNIAKEDFPQDVKVQLIDAVKAVFNSWMNERAIVYRKLNDIPSDWGTAVNVQEMVYGNKGLDSGTGVAFTRNPSTGEKGLFGEYLINAQGEDVVAGIRTPESIDKLKEEMPNIYDEFVKYANILESHYKDMQDMEFTIENGKLYMLQTRNGKRTGSAAVKIAVDMVKEGMITKEEALLRVEPKQLEQLLHPSFDTDMLNNSNIIAKGLAASKGVATGHIYFNKNGLENAISKGIKDTILIRLETSPEDIEGMNIASGILTIRGGMTSHAAVVARGMGKCCVCGCNDIVIDEVNKKLVTKDGNYYNEGDYISIDGNTGNVYGNKIDTVVPTISGEFKEFLTWANEIKTLEVRANADTNTDATIAKEMGATGIGLCRTEHMFFKEDRIFNFRKMILSENIEEREKYLDEILPYQKEDFIDLFKTMSPYVVTIRYLDPPLHEFLPKEFDEITNLANSMNVTFNELKNRIDSLKEFNPMMGHRGCRLSITYPEIIVMQTKAVIEAAIDVKKEGYEVHPEIMIPLVTDEKELKYVKDIVVNTANNILQNNNISVDYHVGTMIEVPRAAILSDSLAKEAEFFSFGTNDLTQMTYGFSRDDSSKFLKDYYNKNIFEFDPFTKLDEKGVGVLIEISTKLGRISNDNLHIGVCGEQAADTSSIEFFNKVGVDYVSCSCYRVPIAILSCAQAAIKAK